MTVIGNVGSLAARRARLGEAALWGSMALLAVFAAAVALRHVVAANTDVSWLLIAGERWLDGQRLYSDIIETNPPMAVLVYVPAILIGRALDLAAEIAVDGLVFLAIGLSLLVCALILRTSSALAPPQRWPVGIVAFAVLALLPAQTFGQREHIATIELMPALALLALRVQREAPERWSIAVAGLGIGLALAFKPHFALAVLASAIVAAVYLKSWRIIVAAEHLIAAVIVTIYGACTVAFFPDYVTVIVPLVRDVYTVSLPFSVILARPVVPLWAITFGATLMLRRDKEWDGTLAIILAASCGLAIAYFVQRKGFPYHAYPMMAFALLGLAFAATSRAGLVAASRSWTAGCALVWVALFASAMIWFNQALDARVLQQAVARLGLQHPSILAISGNAGFAHPLTRAIGGVWASREQMLLVASRDNYLRETGPADQPILAVLAPYARRERQWLIDDIRNHRPTILLVDKASDDWEGWLRASPELSALLRDYARVDGVMGVDIYLRHSEIMVRLEGIAP